MGPVKLEPTSTCHSVKYTTNLPILYNLLQTCIINYEESAAIAIAVAKQQWIPAVAGLDIIVDLIYPWNLITN